MKTVFISYSHQDSMILEKFKRHTKTLSTQFDFWDDNKIIAGQNWKKEIETALNNAEFAILFISADFFNSDFIEKFELPKLLHKAENNGAVVISVIVKPCLFSEYPEINKYQAINSPSKTIIEMSDAEQEQTWVKLLQTIKLY